LETEHFMGGPELGEYQRPWSLPPAGAAGGFRAFRTPPSLGCRASGPGRQILGPRLHQRDLGTIQGCNDTGVSVPDQGRSASA